MPSKPSILLMDDDDSLRRVTEYTLQEEGYTVLAARALGVTEELVYVPSA